MPVYTLFYMSYLSIHVMPVYTCHACLYMSCLFIHVMPVYTWHACLYMSCLSIHVMPVYTCHACLYISCLSIHVMPVYSCHACLYISCLSIHVMPVYIYHACLCNKMKNIKYHPVRTVPKSNIKIWKEAKAIPISLKLHDRTLDTGTSIKSGGFKLALWDQTSPLSDMMRSCTCFHTRVNANPDI